MTFHLPTQALAEYNATSEGKVYLFTGSKISGGFCVTRKGLLEPSKLGHILTDNPALQNYHTSEGEFHLHPPSAVGNRSSPVVAIA